MSASDTTRIAIWSGPRNLSTSLMRAWESRPDCCVSDEPLYAHYLQVTGLDHPLAQQVIAAGDTQIQSVITSLLGRPPENVSIWYQKHMAHHLLPDTPRAWISQLRNAFLLRSPKPMIASLARALGRTPQLEETGLPQQVQLFEQLSVDGQAPPVLLAEDLAATPNAMLRALCDALNVEFCEDMLSWKAGPRDSDGLWASHWYAKVWDSTNFKAPKQVADVALHGELAELAELADRAQALFDQLVAHRLQRD